MSGIVGSREHFLNPDDQDAIEFINIVQDILSNPDFQKLKNYTHHKYTTRYQHCLNVAWYSYKVSKHRHLNYYSCTRGALLHDFYLYDPHKGEQPIPGRHAEVHPVIALQNANARFPLDDVMQDCIVHHMWPNSHVHPTTPEGMVVVHCDEYCATLEWSEHYSHKLEHVLQKVLGKVLNVKE